MHSQHENWLHHKFDLQKFSCIYVRQKPHFKKVIFNISDAAATEEYVLKPGKNFSCDLTDEGYLVYEQIIPFTAFSPEDLKEGDVFGFSVNHEMGFEDPAAFTDVQLAAGVGFGRNTERLARMTMVAAPHIDASAEQEEVSDPEPEAPESVAQNPQTSDDNLFIYAALCSLLVIAVSWALMQKKVTQKNK